METIKVIEPRVNIKADSEKNHAVLYGAMRVNEVVEVSNSWGSVGSKPVQALFTLNPPSTTTILDRYVRIKCYFEVKTDTDLELGLNDALRQFPIASITDVLNVQINGETLSDNIADKVHAMLCYGNDYKTRCGSVSTTPTAPDAYQAYSDWAVYGSSKNPLANYGESPYDPRGGYVVSVIDSKTFRVALTEPLLMSPFLSGFGGQSEGFVNVNQMNLNFRWKSDLSQILSHSTLGTNMLTVSVSMYQAPELLVSYLTPDLTFPIPQLQVLPFTKQNEYLKTYDGIPAGGSQLMITDSIKLSQIPLKMFLFARHKRATANHLTSDAYLRIDNINVLWNNQSGLLSNATPEQLYEISSKNGLNTSFAGWQKHRGSVMCVEFGKDIGLMDYEAPGVQGQYTVSVQMRTTNVSAVTFDAEFFMVFVYAGTFAIFENGARASLGNLTQQLVLSAKVSDEYDYHAYSGLSGGGFWSDMKGFVNKVARGVQSVAGVIAKPLSMAFPEFAPIISGVSKGADVVRGLTGGGLSGGMISGGRMQRRQLKGRK